MCTKYLCFSAEKPVENKPVEELPAEKPQEEPKQEEVPAEEPEVDEVPETVDTDSELGKMNEALDSDIEDDEFEGFYFETPRKTIFTYETNLERLLKWIGICEEDIEALKIWSRMTEKEQFDYIVPRKQRFYEGL